MVTTDTDDVAATGRINGHDLTENGQTFTCRRCHHVGYAWEFDFVCDGMEGE